MPSASDKELKESLEFIDKLLADPTKFEKWANDALDKSVDHKIGRGCQR